MGVTGCGEGAGGMYLSPLGFETMRIDFNRVKHAARAMCEHRTVCILAAGPCGSPDFKIPG
jgi:hypothetical protein